MKQLREKVIKISSDDDLGIDELLEVVCTHYLRFIEFQI